MKHIATTVLGAYPPTQLPIRPAKNDPAFRVISRARGQLQGQELELFNRALDTSRSRGTTSRGNTAQLDDVTTDTGIITAVAGTNTFSFALRSLAFQHGGDDARAIAKQRLLDQHTNITPHYFHSSMAVGFNRQDMLFDTGHQYAAIVELGMLAGGAVGFMIGATPAGETQPRVVVDNHYGVRIEIPDLRLASAHAFLLFDATAKQQRLDVYSASADHNVALHYPREWFARESNLMTRSATPGLSESEQTRLDAILSTSTLASAGLTIPVHDKPHGIYRVDGMALEIPPAFDLLLGNGTSDPLRIRINTLGSGIVGAGDDRAAAIRTAQQRWNGTAKLSAAEPHRASQAPQSKWQWLVDMFTWWRV